MAVTSEKTLLACADLRFFVLPPLLAVDFGEESSILCATPVLAIDDSHIRGELGKG
jgi:hypothetical protein